MKKALPLALILIGAALLITAVVFWIDSSTSTEPQSFGKTLLDWITLIAGLGASIKGWIDLFKPDKPTPPTTKIDVKSGNPQISTGDHARNIQTETYIENQTIQRPSEPKTPKSLNQLPSPPLDFIGREKELAQLLQNIEKGVVISGVQGMGGIGKTSLGLKLAEQIVSNYPDGQLYLDLRGTHEQTPLTPEQIMAYVIRSFYPEAALPLGYGELGALYRSTLNGKKVLLFYDNARDENQLRSLLPTKSCMLFVTSRQYFTLPGLVAIDLESLTPLDAHKLVQEIAPKVSNKDADTLAEQCGYLPLAIRAAVSVLPVRRDWSSTDLIKRLNDNQARLGLVQSSLSLSYDALDNDLQRYLRQLGVFPQPFTIDEIYAVWRDDAASDQEEKLDDILGKLLKTSLLLFDKEIQQYHFHDLTRLFLEEKLLEDGKSFQTLLRYTRFHLDTFKKLLHTMSELLVDELDYFSEGTIDQILETLAMIVKLSSQEISISASKISVENMNKLPSAWIAYSTVQKEIDEDVMRLYRQAIRFRAVVKHKMEENKSNSDSLKEMSLISEISNSFVKSVWGFTSKYSIL